MKLKRGIDENLEQEANDILRDNRAKERSVNPGWHNDYLSPSQLEHRIGKEIYSANPIEKTLFSGCYHRVYNPKLRTMAKNKARKNHDLTSDDTIQDYTSSGGIRPMRSLSPYVGKWY